MGGLGAGMWGHEEHLEGAGVEDQRRLVLTGKKAGGVQGGELG